MATSTKQRETARQNIKKAQTAQTKSSARAKPGIKGTGDFYRIVVRPKELFVLFRNHDIGDPGVQRVAGKRNNGSWGTQSWLISKDYAHVESGMLVADNQDAKMLLQSLGSEPKYEKGDVFSAKDRPNVPEKTGPAPSQKT
jgi:hypothetical protein